MSDLISRQDAIQGIREIASCADVGHDSESYVYMIQHLPSADRPTGKWIEEDEYGDLFVCSECGFANDYKDNYCPNCGTRMTPYKGGDDSE